MRVNPNVCFEVEQITDPAHWSSVIAWGTYEELGGEDETRAAQLLHSRFAHMLTSETALARLRRDGVAQEADRTTFFRIRLEEKTGRRER
jgi:nitroimidazol reductase NimA-like FMN-containing flavoprotein (pyridoxamine 5'-phosphate oxidase superfamily)